MKQPYHEVKIGQIWRDNDKRVVRPPLRVVKIEEPYCWLQEFNNRGDFGKPRRVQIARMRPTSTGYRLEHDA